MDGVVTSESPSERQNGSRTREIGAEKVTSVTVGADLREVDAERAALTRETDAPVRVPPGLQTGQIAIPEPRGDREPRPERPAGRYLGGQRVAIDDQSFPGHERGIRRPRHGDPHDVPV